MTQEETQEAVLPAEDFEVRIFTLADAAETVDTTGKIYIHGAGVGSVFKRTLPENLGVLALVLRLAIPWHKMTEPFDLRIRALNPDRTPLGPDPIFQVTAEMGRPPGARPGDEAAVNAAFPIAGLPIQSYGTIYFHLEVDGRLLARLPLKIEQLRVARIQTTNS